MYRSELDLQNTFIKYLEANKNKNESVLSEFDARFGNVDIVKVVAEDIPNFTLLQAIELKIYKNAKVVSYLHKKAVRTFEYLKVHTGYQEYQLKSIISKLKNVMIIKEVRKDCYVINADFEFPFLTFISYEAKLKDWKKALSQASNNKKFSSYSYCVFPNEFAKKLSEKEREIFNMYNVGIIGVDHVGYIEYISVKKNDLQLKRNPSLISSIAKYKIKEETM